MFSKLHNWWIKTRSSFWFVPTGIVVGAVGLACILITIDKSNPLPASGGWGLLFGAGAAGARGLLSTVAGSMITVAGVVFSITIVALSLTSSQYTSRVLRNFMADRNNQAVLGVFLGIYAYCLVGLRVIRGGDEGAFVPMLTVLGGVGLAFVGIGCLIFFIHYISMSIQASSIIAKAMRETSAAVEKLFSEELGEDAQDGDELSPEKAGEPWLPVRANKTGYIESVDSDALMHFAREHLAVLRMERGIGKFVVAGTPLVSVSGVATLDVEMSDKLNATYSIGPHRTVEQDVAFGIRQIVDIALKALSPGVNDTTTGVMCVDYLSAILVLIARRRIPATHRMEEGKLRVLSCGPTFEDLLCEAFDQIRLNAPTNLAILTRLLEALETIATQTTNARRRELLREHVDLVYTLANNAATSGHDRRYFETIMARLEKLLPPNNTTA